MRFTSPRDFAAITKISKELMNILVDTPVLLFKLRQDLTKTNSYNEAPKKIWRQPVELSCLISQGDTRADTQLQTIETDQDLVFSFLRQELEEKQIYPEVSDIIFWNSSWYEINNTNETQTWAGREEYRISIVCETHLSRITNLQLEPPNV